MSSSRSVPGTSGSVTFSTLSQSNSRARTRKSTATNRPRTARPRTAATTITSQRIICAVSESRGISPTVGLAFLNLDTCEAVLCQICDTQSYVRTLHKLNVFLPSEILIVSTASDPPTKLFSIIDDELAELGSCITLLDRKYYAEDKGWNYIETLAFVEDVEAMKVALSGHFYAVCSLAAV